MFVITPPAVLLPLLPKGEECPLHHQVGGVVRGQLGGPQERRLCAVFAGDGSVAFAVGADDHPIDGTCCQRLFDRIGEQRLAGEVADVLVRQRLRAAARRDQSVRRM